MPLALPSAAWSLWENVPKAAGVTGNACKRSHACYFQMCFGVNVCPIDPQHSLPMHVRNEFFLRYGKDIGFEQSLGFEKTMFLQKPMSVLFLTREKKAIG